MKKLLASLAISFFSVTVLTACDNRGMSSDDVIKQSRRCTDQSGFVAHAVKNADGVVWMIQCQPRAAK